MIRALAAILAAIIITACTEPSAEEPIGSSAQALTVVPAEGGTFNGTTSGTSQFIGTCGGQAAEAVFQWTAPRSGSATFRTCGGQTAFDTILYVRKGSTTGTELGCNDDSSGCTIAGGNPWASKVTLNVTACTTYFAFVDGWGTGDHGAYTFTLTPPSGTGSSCAGDASADVGSDVSADVASDTSVDAAEAASEGGSDGTMVDSSDGGTDSEGSVSDAGGSDEFDGRDGSASTDGGGSDSGDDSSIDGGLDGAIGEVEGGDSGIPDSGVTAAYPLQKLPGARYLVDQQGNPFLIQGDAPWELIAQVSTPDALTYLDDRQSRGVNSILVSLTENHYSSHPPMDFYGNAPFTVTNDFSTPNTAYFDRADQVIAAAGARGIQLFLFPAYLGWACNTGTGWYEIMAQNGAAKLTAYGQFLGQRYASVDNIVWVMGGDCDPPNKALVEAIASGIRQFDARHLMTTHGQETDSIPFWSGEPWLDFASVYSNTIYAGHEIRDIVSAEYQATSLPVFLIEAQYEFETPATAQQLRQQGYEAILNGGMGQFFGNSPIWCFASGQCLGNNWPASLNSQGAQDQQRLKAFFSPRAWWLLVPDTSHAFVMSGPSDRSAELASDHTWGAAYLPSGGSVTVALSVFTGPVTGRWYNPSTGAYTVIAGSPFVPSGFVTTSPPGGGDWVVVFEP